MKIITLEGAEIYAPLESVSVRKNDDGKCTVWVSGTAVGCIDERTFVEIASTIFSLEKWKTNWKTN